MESILYAEIYLICIIIISLEIAFAIKDIDKAVSMRLFIICFVFINLSFVFDLIFKLAVQSGAGPVWLITARQLFFFFAGLGAFSWFIYSELQFSHEILKTKNLLLTLLPFAASELFLLSETFLLKGKGLIKPDVVFYFPLAVDFGYIALSGLHAYLKSRNKKNYLKKDEYFMLAACAAISLFCAFLQMLIKLPLPLVCAGTAVCSLLLYQKHQSKLISRDPLTGITNRIQLVQYLSDKMNNHAESLYMIMMDIDGLKKINDAYGHNQGDEALIQVSQAFEGNCSKKFSDFEIRRR